MVSTTFFFIFLPVLLLRNLPQGQRRMPPHWIGKERRRKKEEYVGGKNEKSKWKGNMRICEESEE